VIKHQRAVLPVSCGCRARIIMLDPFRILLQGNLKAFTGVSHTPDLIDELALAICEHHTALEHLCLQQQFNAWSVITSSLLQQPDAQGLRAFPVSVLTACQSDALSCCSVADLHSACK
jgi:hypothetical protein